jgi:hypothetical protein
MYRASSIGTADDALRDEGNTNSKQQRATSQKMGIPESSFPVSTALKVARLRGVSVQIVR